MVWIGLCTLPCYLQFHLIYDLQDDSCGNQSKTSHSYMTGHETLPCLHRLIFYHILYTSKPKIISPLNYLMRLLHNRIANKIYNYCTLINKYSHVLVEWQYRVVAFLFPMQLQKTLTFLCVIDGNKIVCLNQKFILCLDLL